MTPTLYYTNGSPPCGAVRLTAAAIGLELNLIKVELITKENLKSEFLTINPQHTVPTLDDGGFILWDSHAICSYLVGKYANSDALYPRDLKKRGLVDQRLHFDGSVLFPRMQNILLPIVYENLNVVPAEKINTILQAYSFIESFLEGRDWLAGDLTIADLCTVATVSVLEPIVKLDMNTHPRLTSWFHRCQSLSYYDAANGRNVKLIREIVNKMK